MGAKREVTRVAPLWLDGGEVPFLKEWGKVPVR